MVTGSLRSIASAAVPPPEILEMVEVSDVLNGGRVAVLPMGLKVKIPGRVKPRDRIEVNLWNGRVHKFPWQERPD